jgi:hypothetical protein
LEPKEIYQGVICHEKPGIPALVHFWRSLLSGKRECENGKHMGMSAKLSHFPSLTLEHLKKHLLKEKLLVVPLQTHPAAS